MPRRKQNKDEKSTKCKVLKLKISNMYIEPQVVDPDSIRYKAGDYELYIDLTPAAKYRYGTMAEESEIHRIFEHLDSEGVTTEGKYRYFTNLFVLDVGKSNSYRWLIEYKHIKDKKKSKKVLFKIPRSQEKQGTIILRYYPDSEREHQPEEVRFKHFVCNASHVRGQKAWFIREDLFDAADEILRCGISKDKRIPHISKWTSYYGLQASDSQPVTMPRMTIVKDFEHFVPDIVDEVTVTEEIGGSKKKPVLEKKYTVVNGVERHVKTMPFDGMGICDISIAKTWAKELGLNYVPGSFQIRLCGVKGCLFVMDVKKFIRERNGGNSIIVNSDGDECDYETEGINVILTDSMFKYGKFYDDHRPFARWLEEFGKVCCGYHRTFNICDYAKNITDLKEEMVTAYQPLQSLPDLTNDEIETLCKPTVDAIKRMHTDVDAFLKFQGVNEDQAEQHSSFLPPYYRALYYDHSLADDPYVRDKMKKSLKRAIEASYTGKLLVEGNYTVVCSDPYALLEWMFAGGDKSKVKGLLKNDEVYSNYWNRKGEQTVTVWRNPHIYTEHWIAACRNDAAVNEWFTYLHSNIVVSIWDTNLLRCNGADTDGDILFSVKNEALKQAVERQNAHTILPDLSAIKKNKPESEYVPLGDLTSQIESEIRGFGNDIGRCTNRISNLWGMVTAGSEDNDKILNHIKSMSVIDSLVIDFPKTGEKIETPKDIKEFMKDKGAKKPRFMMYLPKNKELRKKEKDFKKKAEEEAKKNADKDDTSKDFAYVSKIFSDNPCTMNRICEHMKKNLGGRIATKYGGGEFKYLSLMKSSDENLKYREIYKRVRKRILKLHEFQLDVTKDCKENSKLGLSDSKDNKAIYEAFYASCRYDLLLTQEKGRYVSPDIIIDCCILCIETDPALFDSPSIYNVLWNCFPNEMVERCQGKFTKNLTEEQLEKRAEWIKKTEESTKRNYAKLKQIADNIDRLPCLQNKDSEKEHSNFVIYKREGLDIKRAVKSSKIEPLAKNILRRRRRLLYALLVFARKIMALNQNSKAVVPFVSNSKNAITVSALSKAINEDNIRGINSDLDWLNAKGYISVGEKEIVLNKETFLKSELKGELYSGDSCCAALKKMGRLYDK